MNVPGRRGTGDEASTTLALAQLTGRLARCQDLSALVTCALDGLDELFGYGHSMLLLLDEHRDHLYTLASHGYPAEGVGSEVRLGEGIVGMAAARAEAMRVGNLGSMLAYARTVRRSYAQDETEHEIRLPGLAKPESQLAVPAMVLGQLLGVLTVESEQPLAFSPGDEALLGVVASLLASAIEIDWAHERLEDAGRGGADGAAPSGRGAQPLPEPVRTRVRFYPVDGSAFVGGDYLIKGVAGRLLWLLLEQHEREGRVEFTNREVRLHPSLELPELRDNLESRLILLQRRLDERDGPIHIEKTGRGRFRLLLDTEILLERVET